MYSLFTICVLFVVGLLRKRLITLGHDRVKEPQKVCNLNHWSGGHL